jgi:hypothetical protein
LVEQRIENPRVDGSIPSQATKLKSPNQQWLGLFYLNQFSAGKSDEHCSGASSACFDI